MGCSSEDFWVLQQIDDDAEQAKNAAGGDQSAGVEGSGAGFALVFFLRRCFDEYADESAREHRRGRGDGEIRDGGHEPRLRSGGLVAPDALRPLKLDSLGSTVVKVFTVGNFMRAQGIDQRIALALVNEGVSFDLHAGRQSLEVDRNLRGQVFLEPLVHEI